MLEHKIPDPQPQGTPPILYKYRSFDPDDLHLEILSQASLWFASARYFLDTEDLAIPIDYENIDPEQRMKWAVKSLQQQFPILDDISIRTLAEKRLRLIDMDEGYLDQVRINERDTNYEKFGICSLTARADNVRMWDEYAAGQSGFCVGINTSRLMLVQLDLAARDGQLLDLQQVEYVEKMPLINFYRSMAGTNWQRDIIRLLVTKSIKWCYEEEFRLIFWENVNRKLVIGIEAIQEVILGQKITSENEGKIMDALRGTGAKVDLYRAAVGMNSGKIDIRAF